MQKNLIKELFDTRPKTRLSVLPQNPDIPSEKAAVGLGRFPKWLHRKLPEGHQGLLDTHAVVKEGRLHTVCEEAKCPNLMECYSQKTATFLALGKSCTRACGFCEIAFSPTPGARDLEEPEKIADSVCKLGLKHVVITMVARDDLSDGGAGHIVEIIHAIRNKAPAATIETLTSDFGGNYTALEALLDAQPEIFNHNVETVERLTPRVRHTATYERSLSILKHAKTYAPDCSVKSGIMVGLGEEKEEVFCTLEALARVGCDIVTIGQYLQASPKKLTVKEFVHPDRFEEYKQYGLQCGISHMYVGPFVRSSYNAHLFVKGKRIDSQ